MADEAIVKGEIGEAIELPGVDKVQAAIDSLVVELGMLEFNFREQQRDYKARKESITDSIRALVRSSRK